MSYFSKKKCIIPLNIYFILYIRSYIVYVVLFYIFFIIYYVGTSYIHIVSIIVFSIEVIHLIFLNFINTCCCCYYIIKFKDRYIIICRFCIFSPTTCTFAKQCTKHKTIATCFIITISS